MATDRVHRLWESGRSRASVRLAGDVLARDARAGGELMACALAMRLFILLLPLTAALLAVLGLVTRSDPRTARDALQGVGITSAAAGSVADASRLSQQSLWLVLGGALFALVLASRTTLRAMWIVHALAWDLPPSRPPWPWRGAWAVIGGMIAMLVISLIGPFLREQTGVVGGVLGLGISLAIWIGFWLLVEVLLPHADTPWSSLLPGALVLGVGVALLHAATTLWAANAVSHYSSAYGALGSAVALLLWFYALGRLLVAAAMLNAARWELRPRPVG